MCIFTAACVRTYEYVYQTHRRRKKNVSQLPQAKRNGRIGSCWYILYNSHAAISLRPRARARAPFRHIRTAHAFTCELRKKVIYIYKLMRPPAPAPLSAPARQPPTDRPALHTNKYIPKNDSGLIQIGIHGHALAPFRCTHTYWRCRPHYQQSERR